MYLFKKNVENLFTICLLLLTLPFILVFNFSTGNRYWATEEAIPVKWSRCNWIVGLFSLHKMFTIMNTTIVGSNWHQLARMISFSSIGRKNGFDSWIFNVNLEYSRFEPNLSSSLCFVGSSERSCLFYCVTSFIGKKFHNIKLDP